MRDPSLPVRHCEVRAWGPKREYAVGVFGRGTFRRPSWLLRQVRESIRSSAFGLEVVGRD